MEPLVGDMNLSVLKSPVESDGRPLKLLEAALNGSRRGAPRGTDTTGSDCRLT